MSENLCPDCWSNNTVNTGELHKYGVIWQCNDCDYRWIEFAELVWP